MATSIKVSISVLLCLGAFITFTYANPLQVGSSFPSGVNLRADQLDNCTAGNEGQVAFDSSAQLLYVCKGNEWTEVSLIAGNHTLEGRVVELEAENVELQNRLTEVENRLDALFTPESSCLFSGPDYDNDGRCGTHDTCSDSPLKWAPGTCGCDEVDIDTDGDELADCVDPTPFGGAFPSSNLLAHWTFDEGSGSTASDASGNGHHGTLVNMAANRWVPGKSGSALYFGGDSNGYVQIPDHGDFQALTTMTVSAWYLSFRDQDDNDALISKSNNVNSGHDWIFLEFGNVFYVSTTSGLQSVSISEPSQHEWHHATGIIGPSGGSTNIKIFIDGSQVLSQTVNGAWSHSSSYIRVADYSSPSSIFHAVIDEVMLHSVDLSPTIISSAYDFLDNAVNVSHGLVGYWRLDEMSGSVAADSGPYANDGALEGFASLDAAHSTNAHLGHSIEMGGTGQVVTVPHISAYADMTSMSISLWFVATRDHGNDEALISKSQNGGGHNWIFMEYDTHFYVNTNNGLQLTTHAQPTLNEWHYAVGVIQPSASNTRVDVYVDSIHIHSATLSGQWAHSTSQIVFGDYVGRSETWSGYIDEVRMYNRALSALEVTTLYANY